VAVPTPALQHAAAKHCGACDVRSTQAGLQVCLCDELRIAALHAARVGSVACYVPFCKHRHVGVAVWRHAICECKVRWSAARAMLPRRSSGAAKARVVDHSTYSTVLGRLRPQCPATLEMVSRWFQRELGKARLR